MGRLDGKVAIVFGAGPNIGGTIAHFLAREGARIAVSDLNAEAAEETVAFLTARGFQAAAFVGNAVEETAVAGVVADAVERFGGMHNSQQRSLGRSLSGTLASPETRVIRPHRGALEATRSHGCRHRLGALLGSVAGELGE